VDEPDQPRPLVLTTDDELLDDLLRLGAAAGVLPDVAPDATSARRKWDGAPLILIGLDAVDAVLDRHPRRRPGIVLVSRDRDGAGVWERALRLGAEQVLALPDQQDALLEILTSALDGRSRPAPIVAVIGGRGGSGASTLAAALALVASDAGLVPLLVDADPLGGGLDLLLGVESMDGPRWPDLAGASGRLAGSSLRQALPRVGAVSFLSWHRGPPIDAPVEATRSVLLAGQRSHDLVVVDLPRSFDPAAEEVAARATLTVLVVPPEVRGIAAASAVCSRLSTFASRVGVVVPGPRRSRLDAASVAATVDLPLLAELRHERAVTEAIENGISPFRVPRGRLRNCCLRLLDTVAGLAEAAA